MSDLASLESEILAQVSAAADEPAIEAVRVSALGKKGVISERMATLGKMAPDERKAAGAALNVLKDKVSEALSARKAVLGEAALEARLATETLDMTLPVRPQMQGTIHPVSQVWEEVVQIFGDLGFSVAEGPHIEDDFHNFDALNMPPDHPARQEHDTFYFNEKPDGSRMVLRTHTSPVQIRTMLSQKPPIRIIAPGRTFRSDSDMTHTPMFNQVEGLVLDETTHLGNLKWILAEFCKAFFEVDEVKMRFRASHFPFTEPSMEVDIQYAREGGQLKIGTGDKWLEILGSGMVHPNVIRAGGLDPDKVQGFAFGMGLDRLAMLKYGIPDLRAFFESDLRWLRHYGFRALQVPTLAGGLS
ncbi:phenylalanine--tRNA ligase subunit alpha [Aestuariivirga litoralis]|uniref:phenylalanine--tRNA ligase subunit alpha n=1 Tax=Aestuariivirga litoralis TaxID=2650924 RepID=UPI0018C84660|nr:phenylalanine--tRNA ligase subunit alpha [Aestuariivirga litoralis]MBG1232928.1 phenylalanine--tRNA ligase subunit alpha [Aestuariivirga litoralis]